MTIDGSDSFDEEAYGTEMFVPRNIAPDTRPSTTIANAATVNRENAIFSPEIRRSDSYAFSEIAIFAMTVVSRSESSLIPITLKFDSSSHIFFSPIFHRKNSIGHDSDFY